MLFAGELNGSQTIKTGRSALLGDSALYPSFGWSLTGSDQGGVDDGRSEHSIIFHWILGLPASNAR